MTKIQVEIIRPDGKVKKKSCIVKGGKVIIRKARKTRAEVSAEFDRDCVSFSGWRNKAKVYLNENANKCIPILRKPKEADIPIWDAETERDLFDANVIRATGATTSKMEIPLLLYLMIGAILIMSFLQFLISRGIIRFG